MLGNKYATGLNKTIMSLVLIGTFGLLVGQAFNKELFQKKLILILLVILHKWLSHHLLQYLPTTDSNLLFNYLKKLKIKAIFQKQLFLQHHFLKIGFGLITISIISLIGIKKAQGSVSGRCVWGLLWKKGTDVVNAFNYIGIN